MADTQNVVISAEELKYATTFYMSDSLLNIALVSGAEKVLNPCHLQINAPTVVLNVSSKVTHLNLSGDVAYMKIRTYSDLQVTVQGVIGSMEINMLPGDNNQHILKIDTVDDGRISDLHLLARYHYVSLGFSEDVKLALYSDIFMLEMRNDSMYTVVNGDSIGDPASDIKPIKIGEIIAKNYKLGSAIHTVFKD